MKKITTIVAILLTINCMGQVSHKDYYVVDVNFKLMDRSAQSIRISQLDAPTYQSAFNAIANYVRPYKIMPYSMAISIIKVRGILSGWKSDKFKPNKPVSFQYSGDWTYHKGSFDTIFMKNVAVRKPYKSPVADSTVAAPARLYNRKSENYVWINYPVSGRDFTTVTFKKSSVVFLNDSTFTYVEKFR